MEWKSDVVAAAPAELVPRPADLVPRPAELVPRPADLGARPAEWVRQPAKWLPRPYRFVHALGNFHGDIEVLLLALKTTGCCVVESEASSVDTVVRWSDGTQDTVLVVCDDHSDLFLNDIAVERPQAQATESTVGMPTSLLVYSAQHKQYFKLQGTAGEQPFEQELILRILVHLHETSNDANRNNKVVFLSSTPSPAHCGDMKQTSAGPNTYVSGLTAFAEGPDVDQAAVALDDLYSAARAEAFKFATASEPQQEQLLSHVGGVEEARFQAQHDRPPGVCRTLVDCQPFMHSTWSFRSLTFQSRHNAQRATQRVRSSGSTPIVSTSITADGMEVRPRYVEPVLGNTRTLPLLREQLGLVVVADYDRDTASWLVRKWPTQLALSDAELDVQLVDNAAVRQVHAR